MDEPKLRADLEDNWAVVAEAIQTILRREAYLSESTEGMTRTYGAISQSVLEEFIEGLDVRDEVKKELLAISPSLSRVRLSNGSRMKAIWALLPLIKHQRGRVVWGVLCAQCDVSLFTFLSVVPFCESFLRRNKPRPTGMAFWPP